MSGFTPGLLRRRPQAVGTVGVIAALVFIAVLLLAWQSTPPAIVAATIAAVVAFAVWCWWKTQDLFHPMVFPILYLVVALLGSWSWIAINDEALWRLPASAVRSTATTLLTLTVLGWAVGSLIAVALFSSRESSRPAGAAPAELTDERLPNLLLHRLGRGLLVVLVLAKFVQIYLTSGSAYGEDQTAYGLNAAVTTAAEGLLTVAVLLLIASGVRGVLGSALQIPDAILLGAIFVLGVALLGSRGEFLGPLVLLAWNFTRHRRIPPFAILGAGMALGAFYSLVGVIRSQSDVQQFGLIERFFVDTASPFVVSYELTNLVPSESPYLHGVTYLESLRMALPGPISRMISDGDLNTASFRFRDLLGIDDPNYGLGFAFPAETYWNFGLVGALLVAGAVGFWYARSYFWTTTQAVSGVRQVVYPTLVAALPYAMRSDSLAQLKTTAYPLILFWLALSLTRYVARRREAQQ